MKLQNSKLCVNCESLFEETARCPYCGSEIVVWLSRALGTVLEENTADMDTCTAPMKESPVSQPHICRSGSPATSFAGSVPGGKSLMEFRLACGWLRREMGRVLTLLMVQVCK